MGAEKNAQPAAAPQQHGFKGGVGGGDGLRLGHIGHLAPQLAGRDAADVLAVEQAAAALPAEHAGDTAQQRRLAGAVGAEHGENFPRLEGKVHVLKNRRALAIAEGAVFHRQFHSCHPPLLRIRTIKNGAPMMAVRMEMGISAAVALRATVSTATINTAPKLMEAGSRARWLLPNFHPAHVGDEQADPAHMETHEAVMAVAHTTVTPRSARM